MTTIAYVNGEMAADSGTWIEDTLIHKTKKLHRLKSGSVVGFCGGLNASLIAIKWLDGEEVEKVKFDEVTLLVVTSRGRILKYDETTPVVLKAKYVAIGTGTAVALGAMHHGATAVEAVKAAIAHDSKSRGPIMRMKIKT